MRIASGLVDEIRYGELFDRYITHVSVWVKGEKIQERPHRRVREPGRAHDARDRGAARVKQKNDEHRRELISTIAAWAIDHPGQKIVNSVVFPQQMKRLRETVFTERRKGVAQVVRDLVSLLRDQRKQESSWGDLHEERGRRRAGVAAPRGMGYCEHCALDAASAVLGLASPSW